LGTERRFFFFFATLQIASTDSSQQDPHSARRSWFDGIVAQRGKQGKRFSDAQFFSLSIAPYPEGPDQRQPEANP
jgi:hypothetical protein